MNNNSHHLNLEATRCPIAMVYLRRAIEKATASGFSGEVVITTIEQSMERDLPLYLSNFHGETGAVKLKDKKKIPLESKIKSTWLASGEAIEEELQGVEQQQIFTLVFGGE